MTDHLMNMEERSFQVCMEISAVVNTVYIK
jgi:hypothetical protein